MTFRLPFITPAKKPPVLSDGTQQTNVNLFKNPIPFNQMDWAPVKPFLRVAKQTVTFNNLLFVAAVVAAPFAQTSFPAVAKPPISQVGSTGLNLNLFTNPIPFAQTDWSKPYFPPSASGLLNNSVLFNIPQAPFYTQDFSTTRFIPSATPTPQYPNIALLNTSAVVSAPFYAQDFSKPFFPQVRIDASRQLNPNLFTNPIPFAQYDWSKPVRLQGALYPAPQPYSQSLFPNPIPFAQLDWSKPFKPTLAPAFNQQNYPNFYPVSTAAPFAQLDWSKPFRVPSVKGFDQQPNYQNFYPNPYPFSKQLWERQVPVAYIVPQAAPYNGNLYINQVPFTQYDWSHPFVPPQGKQFSQQPNYQNFYPNSIPFAQYDWSKPYAIRLTQILVLNGFQISRLPAPPSVVTDTHDGVWVKRKKKPAPDLLEREVQERASRRAAIERAVYGPEVIPEPEPVPQAVIPPAPQPPIDVSELARVILAAQQAQHQILLARQEQEEEAEIEAILREIL